MLTTADRSVRATADRGLGEVVEDVLVDSIPMLSRTRSAGTSSSTRRRTRGHHAGMLDQGLDRTERFGE